MASERDQFAAAIAALESQRENLGASVVEKSLAVLRAKRDELEGLVEAAQKLKQVTILFLDVVGSTALAQHLDPEEIHAVLDGALERCSKVVEDERGKVLQYAGDNLLAVFGADESREDDAERAVRCGLALLALGRELGVMVQHRHGHAGFTVRVGIHTGKVLLGGGVDAEGTIRGVAVNIAARMEQTAPPGGLRISRETYRHVRGIFDVEAQSLLQVKGVDDLVDTYLVQRAKPRAFRVANRGIEGLETPMVGREPELARLQEAFLSLCAAPGLCAVTIDAEAGLGKSRLIYEFEHWAETRPEPFHLFRARAQTQTEHQSFGLLRDILAWHFRIADSDLMPVARRKFEEGIAPWFVDDGDAAIALGHAHSLGQLIGLDFRDSPHVKAIMAAGRQIRDRGLYAAAQVFRRMASRGGAPIVLLLEDLHWADNASLDFLDELVETHRDVPMLMVMSARPTLFERRPDWHSRRGVDHRIRLDRLAEPARRELAGLLLHRLVEVPPALHDLVVDTSDGNPFYMEEIVKMLVDERVLKTESLPWELDTDRLGRTQVPSTLTGVLQARLDCLGPRERLALQQAAVIGFVFWDRALAAIDPQAPAALHALAQREFIVACPDSRFDEAREYTFAHHVLHQVTYESLLRRTRRDIHARTATWLAGLGGARINDALGVIAEHFDKADDRAGARTYYARAAEDAATRFSHEPLMRYVARALELTEPDDPALRWRLVLVRERALGEQGQRAEQAADIATLQGLAQSLGGREPIAIAAWRHCNFLERTGDYAGVLPAAREAMRLAEEAQSTDLRLRAQTRAAMALYRIGETRAGTLLAEEGLEAARHEGLREIEGLFLNALSAMASLRVDPVACLNYDEAHLRIVRELGDTLDSTYALLNVGNDLTGLGQHDRAGECLAEGLRQTYALGNRMGQANALFNLSILALREGDAALAQAHARAALDISIATRYPEGEFWACLCLSNAELALGQLDEAATRFERARALSQASGNHWLLDALTGLARVALARGDVHGALAWLSEPLAQVSQKGELNGAESPFLVLLTCHQALRCAGDARSDDMLELARRGLLARAANISDPDLRESYLNRIPEHREIAAAWAARRAAQAGRARAP